MDTDDIKGAAAGAGLGLAGCLTFIIFNILYLAFWIGCFLAALWLIATIFRGCSR